MSGSGRNEREKLVRVRCPNPACRVEIELPPARLGKNEPCPRCAQVITVVPIALASRLADDHAISRSDRASLGHGDLYPRDSDNVASAIRNTVA